MPMAASSIELPPLQLGSPLGRGTSGEVSPVLSHLDGGRYAAKRVELADADESAKRALLEEIRIHRLCSAECHNVVRYAFSFSTAQTLIVLMEECDAVLWDVLSGEPCERLGSEPFKLKTSERLGIMTELSDAVRHCHSLRVLHRDLNPWNVFLVRRHEETRVSARLGDFGLSAELQSEEQQLEGLESHGAPPLDESAIGSLYSAPELGVRYGLPADLFSLGMTLAAVWLSASCDSEALIETIEAAKKSSAKDGDQAFPVALQEGLKGLEPRIGALLCSMIRKEPGKRPTALAVCEELLRPKAIEAPPLEEVQEPAQPPCDQAPKAARSTWMRFFRCSFPGKAAKSSQLGKRKVAAEP